MEILCDRHLGTKTEGLAIQVAARSRNVPTHALMTEANESPEKARAIMHALLEAADKIQAILSDEHQRATEAK